MTPITVIPGEATARVSPLLEVAGWEPAPARRDLGGDERTAVEVVRRGDAVLYVPPRAADAAELRTILLVHRGTRGDRAGMDAADEAARASGAEIVVFYVPASGAAASASMPFRIADHGIHDWAEWREEFLRRFCGASEGVRLTLRISAGPTTLEVVVRDGRFDIIVVSASREVGDGDRAVLDVVLSSVTPVLIVPATGHDRSARAAAELGQRR
ncbi:MAG TPA: hypothetical protein VFV72_10435 [Candidatus Limnocylindrales bacterium]|nr:hypothetical protein [Candidatus Limnocylindrales bacterium]